MHENKPFQISTKGPLIDPLIASRSQVSCRFWKSLSCSRKRLCLSNLKFCFPQGTKRKSLERYEKKGENKYEYHLKHGMTYGKSSSLSRWVKITGFTDWRMLNRVDLTALRGSNLGALKWSKRHATRNDTKTLCGSQLWFNLIHDFWTFWTIGTHHYRGDGAREGHGTGCGCASKVEDSELRNVWNGWVMCGLHVRNTGGAPISAPNMGVSQCSLVLEGT